MRRDDGGGRGRRTLFRIHAWIGVNLGLLLFVICFSGTAAVFGPELNWLADPALRVQPPPADREAVSWQRLHDATAEAFPHAMVLYLEAPRGERWAARAIVAHAPGDFRSVLIDPYTGKVRGQKSSFGLASFLRIFHKQLYIVPVDLWVHGTWIVGALGVALLASALAGLLSMRRWWRALVTLRRGRSKRLFWSDLHRLTGTWALVVAVVIALTGVWYLAERVLQVGSRLAEDARPARIKADDLRQRPPVLTPFDLDRAAARARTALPGLDIRQVALPVRPGDPLMFIGQADAWLVRDTANAVALDPYNGEVLEVRRAEELDALERWVHTADPLHFGTFAGLASRIAWLVAGLLLCAGILAGLYGAWLRMERQQVPRRRLAALAAVVPTLALLAAAGYGTWAYGGDALRSVRPLHLDLLARTQLGPWPVSVFRLGRPAQPGGRMQVTVRFDGIGHPNVGQASLWIGAPDDPPPRSAVRRFTDRLVASLPYPTPECGDSCRLNLAIVGRDGRRYATGIDLQKADSTPVEIPGTPGPTGAEMAALAVFALALLLPLLGWVRLQAR